MYSINQNLENKFDRLDQYLSQAGIDALVCMLPENVVYLTGTYPVHGVSVAVYLPGGIVDLLHPECEHQWIEPGFSEVTLFSWGHLADDPLGRTYEQFLSKIAGKYDLTDRCIGVEKDISVCAPAYRFAEMILPDAAFFRMVSACFPGCRLADCGKVIEPARSIKQGRDLERIRLANRVASLGLDELRKQIRPGMTDVEAASMLERTIRVNGTGFGGSRLVRAYAEVTSGPEGSCQQSMLIPAGQRQFEQGDLVIIELATVVDGYWSDLTRVYCAGDPDADQKRIFNTVLKAQRAAADALIHGSPANAPDAAARKVIAEAGLGQYFIHGTGHGVGWRYHESIPQLGPESDSRLEEGMVTSVEPGVYIPGFGGIRIEDNLVVGRYGGEWLSTPEGKC